jgi:putative lipoic acid-binding regulatory protein
MIQSATNQTKVEVVALRQLMPAQQAHCGVAKSSAHGNFRRLTLRSATEFSQRENCHHGLTTECCI